MLYFNIFEICKFNWVNRKLNVLKLNNFNLSMELLIKMCFFFVLIFILMKMKLKIRKLLLID